MRRFLWQLKRRQCLKNYIYECRFNYLGHSALIVKLNYTESRQPIYHDSHIAMAGSNASMTVEREEAMTVNRSAEGTVFFKLRHHLNLYDGIVLADTHACQSTPQHVRTSSPATLESLARPDTRRRRTLLLRRIAAFAILC